MTPLLSRRALLLATASAPLLAACHSWPSSSNRQDTAQGRLAALESSSGGRLGLFAFDTAGGAPVAHRAAERFPLCSTFKLLAASAVLQRSAQQPELLQRRVAFAASDMVSYSPVTQRYVGEGMKVGELCAAALQYSDNTAGNLLIKLTGGPASVTAFARSIGDEVFRLDRWETELNTAVPGDPRDTTTPASMGASLQRLALGDALKPTQREQLVEWMIGNTTGAARIRAGVPVGWQVGDKTGGGDYGTANDVAVLWPPARPPIVLAIYFTQSRSDAQPRNDVIASATRIVLEAFA